MAWNRPSIKSQPAKKRSTRLWPYIVIAVLVVVVGGVHLLIRGENEPSAAKKTRRVPIADRGKPKTAAPPTGSTTPLLHNAATKKMDILAGPAPTEIKKSKKPANLPTTPKPIYSTGIEQVISWIFNCTPGTMPPFLPPIASEELKDIVPILISKTKISDADSDIVANFKENTSYAKKEMLKYLKEGGEPEEFLRYFHAELQRCFEWRQEAIRQAEEVWHEDRALGKEFIKQINEKFESEGIKSIEPDIFGDDDEPDVENATAEAK